MTYVILNKFRIGPKVLIEIKLCSLLLWGKYKVLQAGKDPYRVIFEVLDRVYEALVWKFGGLVNTFLCIINIIDKGAITVRITNH